MKLGFFVITPTETLSRSERKKVRRKTSGDGSELKGASPLAAISRGTSIHMEIPCLRSALFKYLRSNEKQTEENFKSLGRVCMFYKVRNGRETTAASYKKTYRFVKLWTAPSPAQTTSRPIDDSCFSTSICRNISQESSSKTIMWHLE